MPPEQVHITPQDVLATGVNLSIEHRGTPVWKQMALAAANLANDLKFQEKVAELDAFQREHADDIPGLAAQIHAIFQLGEQLTLDHVIVTAAMTAIKKALHPDD